MSKIENLGFDNWFRDKVDLSKTADFWESVPSGKIARVISVNKNSFVVSNGVSWTSRSYRDVSDILCHGATVAA